MDTLAESLEKLGKYICVEYLLLFMFIGYLIKCHFKKVLFKVFKRDVKFVFVILVLAAIISIPFIIGGVSWQKIILSYALGTSLHELVFKYIEKKCRS
jgi:hypothetical protein